MKVFFKSKWFKLFIILYFILGFLIIFVYMPLYKSRELGLDATVKSNIHTLQIALERYAKENNQVYPHSMDSLLERGYLESYPRNPFAKGGEHMMDVCFFDSQSQGNFTYLPVYLDDEVVAYFLLGYGSEKIYERCKRVKAEMCNRRKDYDDDGNIDNVIIVMESHSNEDYLPSLKEHLQELRREKNNYE